MLKTFLPNVARCLQPGPLRCWSRSRPWPCGWRAAVALDRAPLVALALAAALTLGFGPPSLTESDSALLPVRRAQLGQLAAGLPPSPAAQAALIMDMETGRPLLERNSRTRLAPASITKLMTAVIAVEHGRLDDKVTITPEDLVEGSSMGLQAGDTVTVEQLLWGLLLPSGNDAAQALARHLGQGSVDRFVALMNQKARALRLDDTRFANPHGLDQADHYSTAYDLAMLSRYAMQHPLLARMAGTREITVNANRPFVLRNTNQLLFAADVPGVNGVKTGFTDRAGDSLVASADRDGRRVLVVVLGTANRSAVAASLLDFAYRFYAWVPFPPQPGLMAGLRRLREEPIIVPGWQRPYARFTLERFAPPTGLPTSLRPRGLLRAYVGGDEVAQQALYAEP